MEGRKIMGPMARRVGEGSQFVQSTLKGVFAGRWRYGDVCIEQQKQRTGVLRVRQGGTVFGRTSIWW